MPTTERSEVPTPLMPFFSFRRIWSVSGRSTGFLLVYQRKVASTTCFQPDRLRFPLVEGRVESGHFALVLGCWLSTGIDGAWHPVESVLRSSVTGSATEEWKPGLAQAGDEVPVSGAHASRPLRRRSSVPIRGATSVQSEGRGRSRRGTEAAAQQRWSGSALWVRRARRAGSDTPRRSRCAAATVPRQRRDGTAAGWLHRPRPDSAAGQQRGHRAVAEQLPQRRGGPAPLIAGDPAAAVPHHPLQCPCTPGGWASWDCRPVLCRRQSGWWTPSIQPGRRCVPRDRHGPWSRVLSVSSGTASTGLVRAPARASRKTSTGAGGGCHLTRPPALCAPAPPTSSLGSPGAPGNPCPRVVLSWEGSSGASLEARFPTRGNPTPGAPGEQWARGRSIATHPRPPKLLAACHPTLHGAPRSAGR